MRKLIPFNKKKCLVLNPDENNIYILSDLEIKNQFEIEFQISENLDHESLFNLLNEGQYDFLLLGKRLDENYGELIIDIFSNLIFKHFKVYSVESFFESQTKRIPLLHINHHWLVNRDIFAYTTRSHLKYFKRIFDVSLSLFLIPFITPLILFSALIIKVVSPGPVFFLQNRVGLLGRPFNIYKLRTMTYEEPNISGDLSRPKSRIYPFGLFLRVLKIDELPQVINILRGEMSFIGPRPEQYHIVEALSMENPYFQLRHLIRPGITGWAQVNLPKATPDENLKKLEYDLFYIRHHSYSLEFKIILMTFYIIISRNSN